MMAKQFHFDDEDELEEDYSSSYLDELENKKEGAPYISIDEEDDKEDEPMKKKKKRFVMKWWHYLLILFGALAIAFIVYIAALSLHDGPVYGNRCEGMVSISKDARDATVSTMEEKYDDIESMTLSTECRQLKVDIVFKDNMSAKKAENIAEETVQTLDDIVGREKEDGKTYSDLFGTIDGVTQYEVNVFMTSAQSDDFPIYGTKNIQNDDFSYTLASVRDEESAKRAQETLTDE